MSEAGGPPREWRFYLDDMLTFSGKVLNYTAGFDKPSFITDGLTYDATLRNLELIGEAASRVPQTVRERYPRIPWRQIIATRNRLIHAYLGIDDDTIWSIVQDDIPELIRELEAVQSDNQQSG